jgi:hypothetical protein
MRTPSLRRSPGKFQPLLIQSPRPSPEHQGPPSAVNLSSGPKDARSRATSEPALAVVPQTRKIAVEPGSTRALWKDIHRAEKESRGEDKARWGQRPVSKSSDDPAMRATRSRGRVTRRGPSQADSENALGGGPCGRSLPELDSSPALKFFRLCEAGLITNACTLQILRKSRFFLVERRPRT